MPPRKFGPRPVDADKPCAACDEPLRAGEYTVLVPLGPGKDPEQQAAARAGKHYNAIAVEVHWACATGEVK